MTSNQKRIMPSAITNSVHFKNYTSSNSADTLINNNNNSVRINPAFCVSPCFSLLLFCCYQKCLGIWHIVVSGGGRWCQQIIRYFYNGYCAMQCILCRFCSFWQSMLNFSIRLTLIPFMICCSVSLVNQIKSKSAHWTLIEVSDESYA